jgi:hypothetical protein
MDDSFVILQSERRQFRARGGVIRVKNASNSQTFRDLNEHRGVFDADYVPGWRLSDVQRKLKDVRIGLARVNEAGGNKGILAPYNPRLDGPQRQPRCKRSRPTLRSVGECASSPVAREQRP